LDHLLLVSGGRLSLFVIVSQSRSFGLPIMAAIMEPPMVIVIVSSPSGTFSITTLHDGVNPASLSGLGLLMTTFFPFVASACSGRIRTAGFS
jgi:hypothetical protein